MRAQDYLNLTVNERRKLHQERADKIAALSPTAKAAFDTAMRWGGGISPEFADAIAKAVLEADKKNPAPENEPH